MVNDKIMYVVFFVISIAIVSVVAHIGDSKPPANVDPSIQDVDDPSQIDSENEAGIISFILGNHEDRSNRTNDGA